VEIYEVIVPEKWRGHTVNDLTNPDTCVPVSITRAGKAMLPSPSFVLETGDVVHVSATLEGVEALRARMHLSN
jgi:Trk K+ transport system NAD-binding subunit